MPSQKISLNINSESTDLLNYFLLHKLSSTITDILREAKNESELLQLNLNALSIFLNSNASFIYLSTIAAAGEFILEKNSFFKNSKIVPKSKGVKYFEEMNNNKQIIIDNSGKLLLIPLASKHKIKGFMEFQFSNILQKDTLLLEVLKKNRF